MTTPTTPVAEATGLALDKLSMVLGALARRRDYLDKMRPEDVESLRAEVFGHFMALDGILGEASHPRDAQRETPIENIGTLMGMKVHDLLHRLAGKDMEIVGFDIPPLGLITVACARGEFAARLHSTVMKWGAEAGRFTKEASMEGGKVVDMAERRGAAPYTLALDAAARELLIRSWMDMTNSPIDLVNKDDGSHEATVDGVKLLDLVSAARADKHGQWIAGVQYVEAPEKNGFSLAYGGSPALLSKMPPEAREAVAAGLEDMVARIRRGSL